MRFTTSAATSWRGALSMKFDKSAMLLYAVTDRAWVGRQTLYEQVECAIRGGVTCLQLREKELDSGSFFEEAEKIKLLCNKSNVPFIVNDNVEIAVKCADGVHIGQEDMAAAEVRRIIGKDMILGVSAQTVEQAKKAEQDGADYLGVGAVFPTGSKDDAAEVDYATLKAICNAVSIPVIAIGGITCENVTQLRGSGICGVAVISAIYAKEDIAAAARELRLAVEGTVAE